MKGADDTDRRKRADLVCSIFIVENVRARQQIGSIDYYVDAHG